MGCCFKKARTESQIAQDEENTRNNQSQPLIDNNPNAPASPNSQKRKKKGARQQPEISPFHKPRKLSLFLFLSCLFAVLSRGMTLCSIVKFCIFRWHCSGTKREWWIHCQTIQSKRSQQAKSLGRGARSQAISGDRIHASTVKQDAIRQGRSTVKLFIGQLDQCRR